MNIGPLTAQALGEARALLESACAFDPAARVAEEKLFGAAPSGASVCLGAREGQRLVGVAVVSGRWLRLLAVDPPARRRGIGTALLDAACAQARIQGATRIRTGDQPGNYLGPGIDERNAETIAFFAHLGFVEKARYENLTVPLGDNDRVTPVRARALADDAAARGYTVRRAASDDIPALLDFAATAFAPAWAFEAARALDNDPPGVHLAVATATGAIVAFACHDGNNRGLGWFGPAGTAIAERGKGLGQALLLPCLLDVGAAGHAAAVIAWIGPRRFYEEACGALPDRRFVVLEKNLEKNLA